MGSLRNRVVALVSTVVIAVALIVLPGCKKEAKPVEKAKEAATETKKAVEEAAK